MENQAIVDLIDKTAESRAGDGDGMWYCELIVCLAALAKGEFASLVYNKAITGMDPETDRDGRKRVWELLREAALKVTPVTTNWRVFKALVPIIQVMDPLDVPDAGGFHTFTLGDAEKKKGEAWLARAYGEERATREIAVTNKYAPDYGDYLRMVIASIFDDEKIFNFLQTETLLILAMISQNEYQMTATHVLAYVRNGGTKGGVRLLIKFAEEVAEAIGQKIVGFPGLDELLGTV
ncbi:uncharacterized protein DNG_10434 [Cephalotrichum gorgonifer]|uniref:Uncharacterized protein n=1 Tax=Cephalotrichum gorgonifer TaxID=2041049 RepID=A0AAE8T075_9PEZI|nr:uncharacterized protein DNG_10434 [Cephalotrichum gorgonifer]